MKSKLEELIEKLCPNGVEYKKLEKIITIVSPPKKILSKNITLKGKYPVIDQGADYISGYTNDTEALLPNNNYIIFGDHTETIKYVDFRFAQGADGIKILITKDFDCKYLYYCFINFYEPTGKYTRHWSKAKTTLIPLPPLEIQEEIVRILDKFTELTIEIKEELTTELILRKQQYEHYRDKLLTFGDEVEWKKIKEVFKRLKGTPITATKMKEIASENGEIMVIAGGKTIIKACEKDIPNSNIISVPAVLVQSRGIIDVLYLEEKFTFKNEMWAYTTVNKIMVKYLYYTLKKNIPYLRQVAQGTGALPQISLTATEDLKIPLPPLEEQKRIVEILDRFDKYINDIKEGLPVEIEMRQKQYEYYRNNLLNFKRLNSEG